MDIPPKATTSFFVYLTKVLIGISSNWTEILSSQKLEADKIHTYLDLNQCGPVNYVKLNIYPDGGVSRLRIFGDLSS